MYLSEEANIELPRLGRRLHSVYNILAKEGLDVGRVRWKMLPKLHCMLHMLEWSVPDLGLNPRTYWCYGDEDVVGTLIEVARSCHVSTLAATALAKWALFAFEDS
jgi:hypothetical protein